MNVGKKSRQKRAKLSITGAGEITKNHTEQKKVSRGTVNRIGGRANQSPQGNELTNKQTLEQFKGGVTHKTGLEKRWGEKKQKRKKRGWG